MPGDVSGIYGEGRMSLAGFFKQPRYRCLRGAGAPRFCWTCSKQLMRVKQRGAGLFFFRLVRDQDGNLHRVHSDCVERSVADGCKYHDSDNRAQA